MKSVYVAWPLTSMSTGTSAFLSSAAAMAASPSACASCRRLLSLCRGVDVGSLAAARAGAALRFPAPALPGALTDFLPADVLVPLASRASRAGSRRDFEDDVLGLPLFSLFNMRAIVAEAAGPLNCSG